MSHMGILGILSANLGIWPHPWYSEDSDESLLAVFPDGPPMLSQPGLDLWHLLREDVTCCSISQPRAINATDIFPHGAPVESEGAMDLWHLLGGWYVPEWWHNGIGNAAHAQSTTRMPILHAQRNHHLRHSPSAPTTTSTTTPRNKAAAATAPAAVPRISRESAILILMNCVRKVDIFNLS